MSVDCRVTEYLILTDDYKHTSKISKYKISDHLLLLDVGELAKSDSMFILACEQAL